MILTCKLDQYIICGRKHTYSYYFCKNKNSFYIKAENSFLKCFSIDDIFTFNFVKEIEDASEFFLADNQKIYLPIANEVLNVINGKDVKLSVSHLLEH